MSESTSKEVLVEGCLASVLEPWERAHLELYIMWSPSVPTLLPSHALTSDLSGLLIALSEVAKTSVGTLRRPECHPRYTPAVTFGEQACSYQECPDVADFSSFSTSDHCTILVPVLPNPL